MKIGFDAFPLQINPSGIGKYVLNLIEEIAKEFPDAHYYAYSNKEIGLSKLLSEKVNKKEYCHTFHHKLPGKVWLKFFTRRAIKKDQLDFYISTTGFFPPLPSTVKKIAVVHDFNYKLVPETMGKLHYITHLLYFEKDVRNADFIICNSRGTADKLYNYLHVKAHEIVHPPISNIYKKKSEQEVRKVLEKYKINSKYLLFVGNLEPRKNLTFVLNNFVSLIEDKKIADVKLVIVGVKGWNDSEIQLLLQKYKQHIEVLGYVDEEDLPALYSGAEVFLFPSLYEGFGIPVREALLCGTPVITSNIYELKEAGNIASNNDMVSYIDPNNASELQNSILKYLNNHLDRCASVNPTFKMPQLFEVLKSNYKMKN